MKIWEIIITVIIGIVAYAIFQRMTRKNIETKTVKKVNRRDDQRHHATKPATSRTFDEAILELKNLKQRWIMLSGLLLTTADDDDSDEVKVSLSENNVLTYPETMMETIKYFELPRVETDVQHYAENNPDIAGDYQKLLTRKVLWACNPDYVASFDEVRMFLISDPIPELEKKIGRTALDLGDGQAALINDLTYQIVRNSENGDSISYCAARAAHEINMPETQVWDYLQHDIPTLLNAGAAFVSPATGETLKTL